MSFFVRSLLINWVTSVTSGCIAVLYFFWFSGIPHHFLPSLIWVLGAMMFFGFIIQGLLHFVWLEGEKQLDNPEAWRLHPHKNMNSFVRVLRFPTRSSALAISLWAILGSLGSAIYGFLYSTSPGIILMLILITINCGGLATISQMFLYRLFLFPRLEKILRSISPISEQLRRIPVILPVRAKLLFIALFLEFLVFGMIFSAGYGKGRILIQDQIRQDIKDLFLKMEEEYLTSSSLPESFWDTLWVTIGGPARIINTSGFIVVENKKASFIESHELSKANLGEEGSSSKWLDMRVPGKEYILEARIPWDDFTGELREYMEIFFGSFLLGGMILIYISYSASREYSLSLRRFSMWIHKLTRGNFEEKPRIQDDDDLARIMIHLDRIRNSFSEQIFSMESAANHLYNLVKKTTDQIEMVCDRTYQENEIVSFLNKRSQEFPSLTEEQIANLLAIGEDLDLILNSARSSDKSLDVIETTWRHLERSLQDLKIDLARREQVANLKSNPFSEIVSMLDTFVEFFQEIEEVANSWKETNLHLLKVISESPIFHSQATATPEVFFSGSQQEVDTFLQELGNLEKVINRVYEVAEDTHLSSLNAAIRSTKAKEIGRALTVISDEVRQLADALQKLLRRIQTDFSRFINVLYTKSPSLSFSPELPRDATHPLSFEEYRKTLEERVQWHREVDQALSDVLRLLRNVQEEFVEIHSSLLNSAQRLDRIVALHEQYSRKLEQLNEYISSLGSKIFQKDPFDLKGVLISFEQFQEMRMNLEKFAREYAQEESAIMKGVDQLHNWTKTEVEKMTSLRGKLLALEDVVRRLVETFVLFKV